MSNTTMQPQYQPVQMVEPAKKNGLGITALVLGLVGIPLAIIPFAGPFLGIPLGILALGFAVFGLVLALRGRAGKALPIIGGVLGMAAMAIAIGQATVITGAVDDANAQDTAVVAPQNPGADGNAGAEQQPAVTAGIGDTVTDGDLSFTVTNVETGVSTVGDEYWNETASGQYVIVDVTVENVGSEPASFDATEQYLYNAAGDRFGADTDAMVAVPDSNLFDDINPGNTVQGKIIFDMPEGATPTSIQLHGGMFSDGVKVNLS